MSWRETAQNVITQALLEYEAQQLCLGEPFNMADAFKKVSEAYPFGTRKSHPYKQWLKAVRQAKNLVTAGWSISSLVQTDWDQATNFVKPIPQASQGQLSIFDLHD
jgi:hypothetical protein